MFKAHTWALVFWVLMMGEKKEAHGESQLTRDVVGGEALELEYG